MIKALNTAATGMQAQSQNMEVISNNMANISTNGFKKSRAEFEDLLYQTVKAPGTQTGANTVSPVGVQTGLGVKTGSVQKDFTTGSMKITSGPLDFAVEGNGFFQVMQANGTMAYTRDGAFKKDPSGKLVDRNGNALQPEITIPMDATGIEVTPRGEVQYVTAENNTPQNLGQIELANFINPTGLSAIGKNLYLPTGGSGQPIVAQPGTGPMGTVAQGQLEGSNVNIVEEMVNMITAQRTYETNTKAVQAADQMLQNANNLR